MRHALISLLSILATCSLTAQTVAGPRIQILPVELQGQQTELWCWATSGAMIMGYLGLEVSQCEQVTRKINKKAAEGEEVDCCDAAFLDTDVGQATCVRGGWPQLKSWGFSYKTTKTACKETGACAISWDDLKRQLDDNRPVAFAWRYNDHGSGHMMTAIGYVEAPPDGRYVAVLDPWPPEHGDAQLVPYDYWLTGPYQHWRVYYDIRPKGTVATASTSPPPQGGEEDPPTSNTSKPTSFDTPEAAASSALDVLDALGHEQLSRRLGFANLPQRDHMELGDVLHVYRLDLDDLKGFDPLKQRPQELLQESSERIFPVMFHGEVVSSVTVRQKNDDTWRLTAIGKSHLTEALTHLRRNVVLEHALPPGAPESTFVVDVPDLYQMFLVHRQGPALRFRPIYQEQGQKDLEGPEALQVLAQRARDFRSSLGQDHEEE